MYLHSHLLVQKGRCRPAAPVNGKWSLGSKYPQEGYKACSVNESSQLVSMHSMVGTQAAIPPCDCWYLEASWKCSEIYMWRSSSKPQTLRLFSSLFCFCCWEGGFQSNLNPHWNRGGYTSDYQTWFLLSSRYLLQCEGFRIKSSISSTNEFLNWWDSYLINLFHLVCMVKQYFPLHVPG